MSDQTPGLPPQPPADPWAPPVAPSPPEPPSGTRRRSRWPLLAIVGVLIIGLAVGGYVVSLDDDSGSNLPIPGTSIGPDGDVIAQPVHATGLKAKASAFEVVLDWQTGDGEPQPASYNVYRNGTLQDSVKADETKFVDDTAIPGSTYRYQVVSVDADDNEFPNGAPKVKVKTKSASPSTARLEGVFNARFTETNRFGYTSSSGSLIKTLGFRLKPKCAKGPCTTNLIGLRFPGFRMDLKLSGGAYRGSVSGVRGFARCGNVTTSATVTVTVKPAVAKGVDGEWRVTQATGTLTHRTASQLGCVSSGGDHTFTAKLV